MVPPPLFSPSQWVRQDWIHATLCVPTRVAIAFAAWRMPTRLLGYAFLGIAAGFMTLAMTNGRLNPPEAMGRGAWWAAYRPFHAGMWGGAGVAVLLGESAVAFAMLMIDVAVALAARV